MAEAPEPRGIIPGHTVHRANHHVLVDSGQGAAQAGTQPITVVPIIEANDIVGFEVRCSCGAFVIVECIYEEES